MYIGKLQCMSRCAHLESPVEVQPWVDTAQWKGCHKVFLIVFISRRNSLRRTLSEVAVGARIQDRQRGQTKEDWLAAVTGSSVQCVCSCKIHGPLFLQLGARSACRWRHYVVTSGGGSPCVRGRCDGFASSEPAEKLLKGRWTSPPTLKPTRRGRCSPTWARKHEDLSHMWVVMWVTEGGFSVTVSFI